MTPKLEIYRTVYNWLEALPGPDRKFDMNIEIVISGRKLDGLEYYNSRCPLYTASIDAALHLALTLRPGWTWSVSQNPGEKPEAWLAHPTENALRRENSGQGSGATPAIAICSALFDLLANGEPPENPPVKPV